jgi:hypothetical protein
VLRTNGVPLRPESALCGAAAFCGNPLLASAIPPAGAGATGPEAADEPSLPGAAESR